MSTSKLSVAAASYLLLTTIPAAYAQVFIDSFDVGPMSFTVDPGTQSGAATASGDSSQILGGQRQALIAGDFAFPHSSVTLQNGTGYLQYDRRGNSGFALFYGSYINNSVNVDLQAGGNDRLALNVIAAPAPFQITLQVHDNSLSGSHDQTATLSGSGAGVFYLPFSSFPLIEWDKIAGIALHLDTHADYPLTNGPGTYQFDYLAAVPESGSVPFLASLALAAFGAIRVRTTRRQMRSVEASEA